MEIKDAVKAMAALAHESRLRVFRALVVAGPDGLTPTDLGQALDLPAATLSFQLKELNQAGLISVERQGRKLHYRARFEQVNSLLGYLTENCCAGSVCTLGADTPCDC